MPGWVEPLTRLCLQVLCLESCSCHQPVTGGGQAVGLLLALSPSLLWFRALLGVEVGSRSRSTQQFLQKAGRWHCWPGNAPS